LTKRICHNYKKWEDYKNGMYHTKTRNQTIKKSMRLLSSANNFDATLRIVIKKWKFSTEHNLTDPTINKRAWLGRAACCFKYGACIDETRIAWHKLESHIQDEANHVAENIIKYWLDKKQCQRTIWE